jgi:ParB-like chromosome segregation protein Spo0J
MNEERLIPDAEPIYTFVLLEDLPPLEELNCQKPDPGFVASVAARQLQPVVLIEQVDGFNIVFGNRRIYAAHLAGLGGLYALIYQPGDISPAHAIVAENHHRKPNPFSDLDAIVPLLATRTVEEVAAELHLPVGVVRAAIALQKLDPALLGLARQGKLAAGVALTLARKPRSIQYEVKRRHVQGQKITEAVVKEASTAVVQATMPTLPIANLPGGPGLVFGRALDTEKGVRMVFWHDGSKQEFVVPVDKLYQFAQG